MFEIDFTLLKDILLAGGYISWAIIIFFFISFYSIFMSYRIILKYASTDRDCIRYIRDRITIGEAEELEEYIKSRKSIFITEMFSILKVDLEYGDIASAMNISLDIIYDKLNNNMYRAVALINILSMLGFMGTAVGIVKIVYSPNQTYLNQGFTEAVLTTSFSLILSLILFIFYWYMDGKILKTLEDFEEKSLEIVKIMKSRRLWK